jgi:hypothetical protein
VIDYPRLDTTKMSDRELGYLILRDLLGGAEPTVENLKYWYVRERQKQRQQIRLVKRDEAK